MVHDCIEVPVGIDIYGKSHSSKYYSQGRQIPAEGMYSLRVKAEAKVADITITLQQMATRRMETTERPQMRLAIS